MTRGRLSSSCPDGPDGTLVDTSVTEHMMPVIYRRGGVSCFPGPTLEQVGRRISAFVRRSSVGHFRAFVILHVRRCEVRMKRLALLIPAFLSAGVACRADITIGDPPGFAVNIATFAPTGQSFTADGAALKSIGMWTTTCNCPNDPPVQFQLKLLSGAGTSGALVATRTATAPIGLFGFLDFDFTGVSLVVGQTYTAMMSQISGPPTSHTPLFMASRTFIPEEWLSGRDNRDRISISLCVSLTSPLPHRHCNMRRSSFAGSPVKRSAQ